MMLIFASIAALLAGPATTPSLAPSGKWTVDYRKDMCLASRQFGTGADTVALAIEPAVVMNSGDGTLFILTPNKYGKAVRRGAATISARPDGDDRKVLFVSWQVSPSIRGWEIGGEGGSLSALEDAAGLDIVVGRDRFAFETGKIRPVLDALAKCNDNLMRTWGIDPTARADPSMSPAQWFTDDDYPKDAKSDGAQGRVTVVMTVAGDGRVSACRVVVSAGNAALDKATCDLGKARGRFTQSAGKNDRFSVLSARWVMHE